MADDFSDIKADPVIKQSNSSSSTGNTSAPHAVTGTILRITIIAEAWDKPGTMETLLCGSFEIDGITIDGPPSTATIKATSVPLSTPIRRETHSQGWEDVTLRRIAQEIADRGGLSLMFELDSDPHLDRVDQRQEADLSFLQRLCADHGASMKVVDNRIIIFDEAKYEERDAIVTFKRGDNRIISWSLTQESANVASSATVSYKDPGTGKLISETYEPPNPPAVKQTLKVGYRPSDINAFHPDFKKTRASGGANVVDDFGDIRADAKGTAQTKAKSALREQNKNEWTCDLTTIGNTRMCAGATFNIEGFGVFDGKYIAETVKHSIGSSGYTNDIKGRKTLGY